MQPANQRQIAQKLNISPATVSLVLNDPETKRASEKTKQKIFRLMSGIQPKPTRAKKVLFLTDNASLRFYYGHSILSGAQSRAAELGLKFEVLNPEQDLPPMLYTQDVLGLMVVHYRIIANYRSKLDLPKRTVTLNALHRGPSAGIAVHADHFAGLRQTLVHLTELGHKAIGFLGYEPETTDGAPSREIERIRLFRDASESLGLKLPADAVQLVPSSRQETLDRSDSIRRALQNWSSGFRPTALIAFNDLLAAKTLNIALSMGLRVPEDLSIVGIDNEPMCENVVPRLASISPEFERMGRLAVNLVSDPNFWLDEDTPCRVVIDSKLVARDSLGPAKS